MRLTGHKETAPSKCGSGGRYGGRNHFGTFARARNRFIRSDATRVIYLLDTNAVSDLMRSNPRIEDWIAGLDREDRVVTCTIVRGETLFGIARLPTGRRRTELEETGHRFLTAFRCEPIPERAAGFYTELKAMRQQRGFSLDESNLRVAATAMALEATTATFAEIPGLAVVALN
jgi:predicted nucleic acid-binding protein